MNFADKERVSSFTFFGVLNFLLVYENVDCFTIYFLFNLSLSYSAY